MPRPQGGPPGARTERARRCIAYSARLFVSRPAPGGLRPDSEQADDFALLRYICSLAGCVGVPAVHALSIAALVLNDPLDIPLLHTSAFLLSALCLAREIADG